MASFLKIFAALCGALVLGGCSTVSHTQATPVRVAAAESLRPALLEIASLYAENQPFVRIDVICGNACSLTRQMLKKVPADIAILDSPALINELVEKDVILAKSRATLLINALVCVAKADGGPASFEALAGDGTSKLAVGDFAETPLGQYTERCLESLGELPKFKDRLLPCANSDAVVAAVLNGEAAAGVAYQSTAAVSRGVRVLTQFPIKSYGTIAYEAGVLRAAPHYSEAWEFLTFLRGAQAAAVFQKHGLTVPLKSGGPF